MAFIDKDPPAHKGAKFINILCHKPIGELPEMGKAHLRHALNRARLVCRWLEGIPEIITKLEKEF